MDECKPLKMGSREETNMFFKQQAEINFDNFDYIE